MDNKCVILQKKEYQELLNKISTLEEIKTPQIKIVISVYDTFNPKVSINGKIDLSNNIKSKIRNLISLIYQKAINNIRNEYDDINKKYDSEINGLRNVISDLRKKESTLLNELSVFKNKQTWVSKLFSK
jgi:predicted  nucleic acid-binding Zn-ribbon protein